MEDRPELIILAPAEPNAVYTQNIRQFVDCGVWFPFGQDVRANKEASYLRAPDDYSLPRDLPADLRGVKCVMVDPARRGEFEREPIAERLRDFQRQGGYVYWPDLKAPAGGVVGDSVVRHWVLRAINTAGLTTRHPRMIARLQAMDEPALIAHCKGAAPDELSQYVKMNAPFTDPVGMWTLPAAVAAAEFFGDPSLAEPVWEHIAAHYERFAEHFDSHGARYFLQYAQRTGDRRPVEHVLSVCSGKNGWPRMWRHNGVWINCDLKVPEGCDPDAPPAAVLENVWAWPETLLIVGETFAMLTNATGDPAHLDRAVAHARNAHRWLFDPPSGLYWHVGRPAGPDKRFAPWGRGDSHFLWGLRALLDQMPAEDARRAEFAGMMQANLEGLLRVQDKYGLWRNVLDADDSESRQCSSATSQFVRIYARAFRKGWVRDERIPPMVERAWLGLKTKIWEYRYLGYCVGTAHGLTRQNYLARPHDSFRCSRSSILDAWIEIQLMREAAH